MACEKQSKEYKLIEKFTPSLEINSLGLNNFKILDEICKYLDNFFFNYVKSIKSSQIKPFRFNYYFLKYLIDTITVKILVLENFFNYSVSNNKDIYFIDYGENNINGEFFAIDNKINVFSILLKNLYKADNIYSIPKTSISENIKKNSFKKSLTYLYIKRISKFLNNFFYKNSKKFFLFSLGHDIEFFIPELKKNNYKQFYIDKEKNSFDNETKKHCTNAWESLKNDEIFKNFFTYKNKNYFRILENYFSNFIKLIIPKSLFNYHYVLNKISKEKIDFVLTGSINLGTNNRCMMLAFQKKNIPLITYTEGAGYGSYVRPIADVTEYLDGDVLFCYGKGNVEYFDSLNLKSNKKLVPVGSCRQYNINQKLKDSKKPASISSIMYVANCFQDNRVSTPFGCITGSLYFNNQIKILKFLKTLSIKANVSIKPQPNDSILKETLKLDEYEKLKCVEGKLEKKIKDIDIFIIDYPSTALLDVINTNSYIFFLLEKGYCDFSQKQKERLKKRTYFFDNFDEMINSINLIVDNANHFPLKLDQSFMNYYSVPSYLKDPAVTALKEIIKLKEL